MPRRKRKQKSTPIRPRREDVLKPSTKDNTSPFIPVRPLTEEEKKEIYQHTKWCADILSPHSENHQRQIQKLQCLYASFREQNLIDPLYVWSIFNHNRMVKGSYVEQHLIDLLDLDIPFDPAIFDAFREETSIGFFVTLPFLTKYVEKKQPLHKTILCGIVHNDDIECLRFILSQNPELSNQVFVFAAGTNRVERIRMVYEYAVTKNFTIDSDWFLPMLETARDKMLQEKRRSNSGFPYYFHQNTVVPDKHFLDCFEFICEAFGHKLHKSDLLSFEKDIVPPGVLELEQILTEHHRNEIKEIPRDMIHLFDSEKYADIYSRSSDSRNSKKEEVTSFFDYNGPISFRNFWTDEYVDNHRENVSRDFNYKQIFPRQNDLLFYKRAVCRILEKQLERTKASAKESYENIYKRCLLHTQASVFLYTVSEDEFIHQVLSGIRLNPFYTRLCTGIDLKDEFPMVEEWIKKPHVEKVYQTTSHTLTSYSSVLKDVVEYVMRGYI